MRLIDLGMPISVNGRGGWGPKKQGFMAVRLPVHHAIDPELRRLGLTPVEIADMGRALCAANASTTGTT